MGSVCDREQPIGPSCIPVLPPRSPVSPPSFPFRHRSGLFHETLPVKMLVMEEREESGKMTTPKRQSVLQLHRCKIQLEELHNCLGDDREEMDRKIEKIYSGLNKIVIV